MRRPRRLTRPSLVDRGPRRQRSATLGEHHDLDLRARPPRFPLIELLTAKYRKLKHGKVSFKVSQGGATRRHPGRRGRQGQHRRLLAPARMPTDPAGLVFYPIAKYFVCVVTNPANPISNLTAAQVQQIFTGQGAQLEPGLRRDGDRPDRRLHAAPRSPAS